MRKNVLLCIFIGVSVFNAKICLSASETHQTTQDLPASIVRTIDQQQGQAVTINLNTGNIIQNIKKNIPSENLKNQKLLNKPNGTALSAEPDQSMTGGKLK